MGNKVKILIPEGYFEGNCYTCFHAKTNSEQDNEKMFCKECNRYVVPIEKKGCPSYLWKIKGWLGLGIMVYIAIAVIVIVIENFIL